VTTRFPAARVSAKKREPVRSRRSFVVVLLGTLCLAAPMRAQTVNEVPSRPRLAAGVDTNDFHAYYDLGVFLAPADPTGAAAAFYWALRLNPGSAESMYGRHAALLMSNKWRLYQARWRGNIGIIRDAEYQRIDSLYFKALQMNPFLYRNLDKAVLNTMLTYIAEEERGRNSSASELQFWIAHYLEGASPDMRAWMAHGRADFPTAITNYGLAIQKAHGRYAASLLVDRARLLALLGQLPQALTDLTEALKLMRRTDASQFVFVYESKALLEYSVGMLQERNGATDSAKAAYNRAIQEDLSFYPAHLRLGQLALQQGDTTTALSELELASQLGPGDAPLHFMFAYVLATLQRNEEAERELRKAIALEPYFARPYALLGDVLAAQNKLADARVQYQEFLARAPRGDPQRPDIESNLAGIPPAN